ncbi:MAG: hypothetical protein K8S94_07415 [Planctomycetia bacterium]|nr:hypothetical protein [Planctomycetia bacterium]
MILKKGESDASPISPTDSWQSLGRSVLLQGGSRTDRTAWRASSARGENSAVCKCDRHSGLEKEAIADILVSKGISQETISRVIAHDWFRKKPTEELWEIWAEFSAAASASLNPSIYNELIDEIVRLCRLVADASGGFMGLGKISATETQAIDRVIRTLQQTDTDRMHAESSSVAVQALTSDQNGVVGPCLTQEPT